MSRESQMELPPGWAAAPLSHLIKPRREKASPSDYPDAAFIGMDHVESHTTRLLGTVAASVMKSTAVRFRRGDVLYGRLRPYLNKVALPDFDGLASGEFIVLPETECVSSSFLKHRLSAADFVSFASHLNEGDRPRVNFEQIGQFMILIPPPREQRRIVAKIEELFSKLDAGVEILKKARARLATYRQAVLKHAFEGNLTSRWRAKNTDRSEPTSAALHRIRQEQEASYQAQLSSWKCAIDLWDREGRKAERPSKPRNSVRATPLSPDEISVLHRLPDRWTWCRIDEIGQVQLGRQRSPKHASGPSMRPYLRVANVFESRIDISDVLSMNFTPSEFKVYELKSGDILLNEGQSLELVGRPAMFNGEIAHCCFQNTLVRFRPGFSLDSRYALQLFVHYLKSGRFRKIAKWTNNIAHLGARRFADLEFPLCPLPEQQEIVRVLDNIFAAVERIEREVDAALQWTRTLRQAILKQAFSGKLVAQDPHEAPVSALLDRISAGQDQFTRHANLRKIGKRKKAKVIA